VDPRIVEVARTVVVDRCFDDLALDTGIDVVRETELNAGIALLRETRTDYDLRAQRVTALADAAIGQSHDVGRLYRDSMPRADGADVHLWLGATIVAEAWQIRGMGGTDADRLGLFRDILRDAQEPLLTAASLAPDDPVPWAMLQNYAMGMGMDRANLDALWARIADRCPTLFFGNVRRLQALAAKWGGSHEEMFAFARAAAISAPAGDPLTAMLPLAHAEYLGASGIQPRQHFNANVVDELVAAESRWRATARPRPDSLWAHNIFGWAMLRAGDDARAVWHLSRVNRRSTSIPWAYEDDTATAFATALVALGMTVAQR
jgi:hypothetical protein